MKKPLILLSGGQARDRHFLSDSLTLNKTYTAAVIAAGGVPVMALSAEDAEDYAALCDGFISTGSHEFSPVPGLLSYEENARRNVSEHKLQRAFIAAGKPIFGICMGMQQLNVVFGGDLRKDFRLAEGVEHNLAQHPVETAEGSLLNRLFGTGFWVNSLHNVRVDTLAPCLRPTAISPDGVVEAFEHESLPIYGFQFHPERMRGDFPNPVEAPDTLPLFREFVQMCAKK